jgi:hypothetical protein
MLQAFTGQDELAYHQSPSPKKAAPNFDVKPSNEDSVLSGHDEDGWGKGRIG